MIVVSGRFRLPRERIAEASPRMAKVIAASRGETGCRGYCYAEDVTEPGLFRVYEEWDSLEALREHFATAHMREWQAVRETLGFHYREVSAYDVGGAIPL
jgi:quinol monooxygenase YgiN